VLNCAAALPSESVPQSPGEIVGLGIRLVLHARPEEAAQAVLASPRHDVHVEVSDALAHHVVDRDERAVATECGRHSSRYSLHPFEQRSDEIGIEVGERHDVAFRYHEHVSFEHGGPVEEGDDDVVVQHGAHRQRPADRITELAPRFDHECILPPRQDDDMDTPRIAPVTNPTTDVTELFDKAGLRAPDGSPLNIFGTLAHHPALLRRWLVFATHVLAKNSLTPRDRELLILRTGWRCSSQYEFSQHAVIALRSEITADEVPRTKLPVSDGGWNEDDAGLLNAVDELHDDARISDGTWHALAARLSEQQLLDVIFTVGNYHVVSFALNSCGVELDPGVTPAL
jgi:4-carboxymuconolactone decarboxylase